MKERVELTALFPDYQGENVNDWSNYLLSKSAEYGTYRQCSLGWHAECSQRGLGHDAECMCLCHDPEVTYYSVEGHAESGEPEVTRVKKGKKHWPPKEGEPATMWAHWILAYSKKDAKKRAVAQELALRSRSV